MPAARLERASDGRLRLAEAQGSLWSGAGWIEIRDADGRAGVARRLAWRERASLARALGETRAFPPLLIHLVASGEASGKLERMLERAAHLETQALERRRAVFLTLLEPAMILVMGGIVLLIVLAILLPIIEINQLVH
jgi:type II secretion system (T2SS) protein F